MKVDFKIDDYINEKELDFLFGEKFKSEFPKLMETMKEPKYTIKDLNISPRDATYWDKQGILPELKPGSIRKYNLSQSIWIKLIQQMRSLGIDLKSIKKLKENLLVKVSEEVLISKNVKNYIDSVLKKLNVEIGVDSLLNDPDFIQKLKNKGAFFEHAILAVIVFRVPLTLIVNKNGDYYLYNFHKHAEFINKHPEFSDAINSPHFSLSISEAYASLVIEWFAAERSKEVSGSVSPILSNAELEIIENIRKDNVESLTIKFSKGKPYLLEVSENKEISLGHRFLDIILKNAYQKITLNTRKGEIVNFKNIIQKKLNN